MKDTQQEIDRLFKIGGNTPEGCRNIMLTLNDMMDNDKYDRSLIIEANNKALRKCRALQLRESQIAWVGELRKHLKKKSKSCKRHWMGKLYRNK